MRSRTSLDPELRALARAHGVQTSYKSADERSVTATRAAVIAVLQALGVAAASPGEITDSLGRHERERLTRALDPVHVAWDGDPGPLEIVVPARWRGSVRLLVTLEDGTQVETVHRRSRLAVDGQAVVDGTAWVSMSVPLETLLPFGVHRVDVGVGDTIAHASIIAAPRRAQFWGNRRAWGIFAPLYALHSRRSLGIGDLADLERLGAIAARHHGTIVATLPLLAAFLDQPCEPSPYAPVSRRFWNELHLDLESLPELDDLDDRRTALAELRLAQELRGRGRSGRLVDHAAVFAARRVLLQRLADRAAEAGSRQAGLGRQLAANPEIDRYAMFRALADQHGVDWRRWPAQVRSGDVPGRLARELMASPAFRYHRYAQAQMAEQLGGLARRLRDTGQILWLDLPIGSHPDGYDVWTDQASYATGVSIGAPPDRLFQDGQSWGLPPLRPEAARRTGHSTWWLALREHLRFAGLLRVDHVMGLYRQFWVPDGMQATEGVYVRQPAEELLALLCLESHRSRVPIVGENLGVVPAEVNRALHRHQMLGCHVYQFAIGGADARVRDAQAPAVASLDTHDTPSFAAYLDAADIDLQLEIGLIDQARATTERHGRQKLVANLARRLGVDGWAPDPRRAGTGEATGPGAGAHAGATAQDDRRLELVDRMHELMARSPSPFVVVNLEDLWLEPEPQNVPGTGAERPNWRRRTRYSLDEIARSQRVDAALARVGRLRKKHGRSQHS